MPASTDALLSRLLEGIGRERERALALRRRLHEHPELAHAEHATADAVAAELPVPCTTDAGTGRLALIGAELAGAPIAIRAELDGLPIEERTGVAFSATGAAMHACGHDVHMAALVALARAAHAVAGELPAPLLAVFQPSEEAYPSGAQLLARGKLAAIRPAAIVAAHVHPEIAWGEVALDAGTINAASDSVEITVEGRPAHGAYPHRGRDPVLALAQIVVALHAQAGRRVDPLRPALVNVGVIEGAGAENVIPERARARAALRAYRAEDREALRAMAIEVVEGVAAAHGCSGRAEIIAGEPALENDARIVAAGRELLAGAGFALAPEWRSCGSDDMSFLGELAPLAIAFVGLAGANGFSERPLHHPELLPPEEAVARVAAAQAALFLAAASAAAA